MGLEQKRLTTNHSGSRSYSLILRALEELITEMPFKQVSVKALVELAGVSRGVFYLHFTNLDYALFGLFELYYLWLSPLLVESVRDNPSPEGLVDGLDRTWHELGRLVAERPAAYPRLYTATRDAWGCEASKAFEGRVRSRLAQILLAVYPDTSKYASSPEAIADLMVRAIDYSNEMTWSYDQFYFDRPTMAGLLWDRVQTSLEVASLMCTGERARCLRPDHIVAASS